MICLHVTGPSSSSTDIPFLFSASWFWVEDGDDLSSTSRKGEDLSRGTPELFTCATDAAAAALAACSDAQKGMSHVTRYL